MINAIAIDDEPLALTVIKSLCDKSENINLQQQLINQQNELETLRKTNLAYEQYFQKQKTEFSKLESQLSDLQNSELKSQILQNPYPPKDGKP